MWVGHGCSRRFYEWRDGWDKKGGIVSHFDYRPPILAMVWHYLQTWDFPHQTVWCTSLRNRPSIPEWVHVAGKVCCGTATLSFWCENKSPLSKTCFAGNFVAAPKRLHHCVVTSALGLQPKWRSNWLDLQARTQGGHTCHYTTGAWVLSYQRGCASKKAPKGAQRSMCKVCQDWQAKVKKRSDVISWYHFLRALFYQKNAKEHNLSQRLKFINASEVFCSFKWERSFCTGGLARYILYLKFSRYVLRGCELWNLAISTCSFLILRLSSQVNIQGALGKFHHNPKTLCHSQSLWRLIKSYEGRFVFGNRFAIFHVNIVLVVVAV